MVKTGENIPPLAPSALHLLPAATLPCQLITLTAQRPCDANNDDDIGGGTGMRMRTCHVTVARFAALQTKAPVVGGTGITTLA